MKNESDEMANNRKTTISSKSSTRVGMRKDESMPFWFPCLSLKANSINQRSDVSHLSPKMYVVGPQFFIPIITILRKVGVNSHNNKVERALLKAQTIDIKNFEIELESFKPSFAKIYDLASRRFQTAMNKIDKSIGPSSKDQRGSTL